MARIRDHVDNAPITEALIDLQVSPRDSGDLELVQKFAGEVDGYEQVGPIMQLETTWAVSKDDSPKNQSKSKELGVRLQSVDKTYVIQARTHGLTVSRLAPYETWEELLSEARRRWLDYVSILQPDTVTRVATRFINTLKLPMQPGEEFQAYLSKPPDIPDGLPQAISGFMQRMVVPNPELGATANLIQLLEEGVVPDDHVPIILDIDVYKSVSFAPDSDEAWKLLEQLRVYKNAVFFASLTEKTVELFE